MNHAETLAKRLLETILPARMNYRHNQSNGQHDFDLCYHNGRVVPVEVTSSCNESLERTNAAIRDERKGGSAIKTKSCKLDWYITPNVDANINRIRSKADEYLAAVERDGYDRFYGPVDWHSQGVARIYRELRINSGSVMPWKEHGYICFGLPGGGGKVNAGTLIRAVEREAFKADNRRKLGVAAFPERHLAVYVSAKNYLPWCALNDLEPNEEVAKVPCEITHVWAFTESRNKNEYVVWCAPGGSPWRSLGRITLTDSN